VGGAATLASYTEQTATDYADAVAKAGSIMSATVKYVAVQVGADVVVFADTNGTAGLQAGDDAVVLVGRSLTDIDYTNIV
jgi:hypothetical protein